MVCPAKRSFIAITEISSPDTKSIQAPKPQIRCFLKRSYCTCETFSSKVIHSAEMVMVGVCLLHVHFEKKGISCLMNFSKCDHLLAANLAERLKIMQEVQLTDEEFGEALYLLRTP